MLRSPRPHRVAPTHFAAAILVFGLIGCASTPPDQTAKPKTEDALRIAQAATDPVLSLTAPKLRFGNVVQHPYVCAGSEGCQPQEGWVSREITPDNVSNAQIVTLYLQVMNTKGWLLVDLFCGSDANQYVIVGAKRDGAKTYPGRLEISAKDKAEIKISVAAFGSEAQFSNKVDPAGYPQGTCSTELRALADAAKQSLGSTTDGFAPGGASPKTTPKTTTTTTTTTTTKK